jgi:uncharacterized protein
LDQLKNLVDRFEPARVSDHACFARVALPGRSLHAQDLLPIPLNDESLDRLVSAVNQVQERLRRPMLVEHLSAYLRWDNDTLAEPEFFNALTQRTGCQLLLDVNNLLVNAKNESQPDPLHRCKLWIDALRVGSVGEIHLAGHAQLGELAIDDHGCEVSDAVWALYRHALDRLGPLPSLVEWDTNIPPLDVLLAQAQKAANG